MRLYKKIQRDPQRRPSRANCSLCGRELYQGDVCLQINGSTLCPECLGEYAARFFAAHRRVFGEEGRV